MFVPKCVNWYHGLNHRDDRFVYQNESIHNKICPLNYTKFIRLKINRNESVVVLGDLYASVVNEMIDGR